MHILNWWSLHASILTSDAKIPFATNLKSSWNSINRTLHKRVRSREKKKEKTQVNMLSPTTVKPTLRVRIYLTRQFVAAVDLAAIAYKWSKKFRSGPDFSSSFALLMHFSCQSCIDVKYENNELRDALSVYR